MRVRLPRYAIKVLALFLLCLVWSCHPNSCNLEPTIGYSPPQRFIESLPPAFAEPSPHERDQDWGQELFLGKSFAKETDFYRAITCFKRALFLLPKHEADRRFEIEYNIFLAYYAAGKYAEAVEAFEGGHLMEAPATFPTADDLFITLYDAYMKTGQIERAGRILSVIAERNGETAAQLSLGMAITQGDFPAIEQGLECSPAREGVYELLATYQSQAKSVRKAQLLNAVLPGAGYLYVGQKKSALTSFLINALFIAASYQLFERGYIPAAVIMTSLEFGWYFGGINGAGLEAKQYNEWLFERLGRETMVQERLFPILMIQKGF